jgi:uncharacterized membrane protein YdjX (TVP38/TMEM64 family)
VTGPVPDTPVRRRFPLALVAWIAIAAVVVGAIYWSVSTGLLSWEMAVEARAAGQQFVAQNMILAYAGYVLLFVVLAVVLFPAQLWIIVFGAMLFGFWPALAVSWAASLLGAVCVFVMARGAMGDFYRAKASRYLARIEQGFQRNQLSWMLTVRFIPIVPYFVSNVAPAFLGARLAPFAIAAAIGVVPYVAGYSFVGAQTASVFDEGKPPDVTSLAVSMAPVLLVIATLPMLAILMRRWLSRRRADKAA